jgi:hypothetical protein
MSSPSIGCLNPSLTLTPTGEPYLVFAEYVSNSPAQIFVKSLSTAGAWVNVGSGSLNVSSKAQGRMPQIAGDSKGNVYVVFTEVFENTIPNKSEIYVKQWNGSTWTQLGAGISNDPTKLSIATGIAIDGADKVYVVMYGPGPTDTCEQIYVKSWDGTNWNQLGGSLNISASSIAYTPKIAFGNKATIPYVTWCECNAKGMLQVYVKSWKGSTWQSVGGSLNTPSAFDADAPTIIVVGSTPYVAFTEQSRAYPKPGSAIGNLMSVKTWDGKKWVQLGPAYLNYYLGDTNNASGASLAEYLGKIYVGWSETNAGGISAVQVKTWK